MVSRLLEGLVGLALRRPRLTLALALLSAAGSVLFASQALTLDSDENDLFSAGLELAERRAHYYRALPALADPIIVVIEAAAPGAAAAPPGADLDATADALVAAAAARPALFRGVYGWPDRAFRTAHGALYLPQDRLAVVLDRIVLAQPVLGALSRDPGLAGLLRTLGRVHAADTGDGAAGRAAAHAAATAGLDTVLGEIARVLAAWRRGEPGAMDWQSSGLDAPGGDAAPGRRILFVLPVVDYASMDPAGPAVTALRAIARALPAVASGEVAVRLTGVPVLAHDDGEHVAAQAGLAGAVSLALVLAVLARGLGSWRMLGAVAATLLAGLAWTVGLATVLVGHLNVISIAFGVLAIGLGVDFAIHFALRFAEARPAAASAPALREAARATGPALALCAATTAAGMLAFTPTDFDAMAELGVIMAGGMAACLLATFSVLPALLAGMPQPPRAASPLLVRAAGRLVAARPRTTVAVFAALALAAAGGLSQLRFDANPLAVRDPHAPSVQALQALLDERDGVTWNMNVLVAPHDDAAAKARRLRALDSVADVRTAADYLPGDQTRKLAMIDDAALAASPARTERPRPPLDVDEIREALLTLAHALRPPGREADRGGTPSADALADEARAAAAALAARDPARARAAASDLQSRLLDGLEERLADVEALLAAEAVTPATLPPELAALVRARDGSERLEVLPAGDLTERRELARFVEQVLSVAPGAFGEAYVIHRLGALVVDAFALATALAFGAVVGLVWLAHRSLRATALVALPLALACMLTLGAAALLGVRLDFANVIVLPLLLGIGVDTSIHLVHRALTSAPQAPILESYTARAVLLSGLTTLASFGTLALSRHLGLASLGQLLCLGVVCVLAVNLLFLPALLALARSRVARPACDA